MTHQHTYRQPYQQPFRHADQPPAAAPQWGASPGSALHWVVPVGRSWQSVTAGYVALFAIFCWPLGPVALGLGAWAFARARTGGHGRGRATFAVVVGAVTTVLLLLILGYCVRSR